RIARDRAEYRPGRHRCGHAESDREDHQHREPGAAFQAAQGEVEVVAEHGGAFGYSTNSLIVIPDEVKPRSGIQLLNCHSKSWITRGILPPQSGFQYRRIGDGPRMASSLPWRIFQSASMPPPKLRRAMQFNASRKRINFDQTSSTACPSQRRRRRFRLWHARAVVCGVTSRVARAARALAAR